MLLTKSEARPSEIWRYTDGECHVFAICLHRMTGWSIEMIIDEGNAYWVDPDNETNLVPSVIHAYCVDEQSRLWDVRGCRDRSCLKSELAFWYATEKCSSRRPLIESDLIGFVSRDGCVDEEHRFPLSHYSEADIAEARKVIVNGFASLLPGLQQWR